MLCCALLLVVCLPSGGAQTDSLVRLNSWVERARAAPRSVDAKRIGELRALLGELRVLRASKGTDLGALDLALVELAAVAAVGRGDAQLASGAALGRQELESELARGNTALAARLAEEVLAPAAKRPPPERELAAALLEGAYVAATLPALCAAAREPEPDLAREALESLVGWPHSSVNLFFLEELARGAPCVRLAGEHFQRARAGLSEQVLEALQQEVAQRYLSEDWREAARARRLVSGLTAERAVPILIEALNAWNRRTLAGQGSKRIQAEIVLELQTLSGRAMGPEPEQWMLWWEAVRSGRIALAAEVEAAGGQNSSASFFGLQAVSDRVVFVVDVSGSMRTAFGTSGRSRHDEAIAQLVGFLTKSGEDTRFSVAVFSDKGVSWRTRLAPANAANLALIERWLTDKPPEGETLLFEGLRAGLNLDGKGRLALERCEADTVIVLCDGATTEGSDWVARWLLEENERAQLVFHCVQIGAEGNGTLEALARGTGGEFVRVKG